MDPGISAEPISPELMVYISREHRFGTDAFLLSDFAAPRRKDTVCDLCSGCGIVALLWFRERADAPRRAYCVEIQQDAAALLRRSVEQGDLQGRVAPVHADLRGWCRTQKPEFDLVTCNPPYKVARCGLVSERPGAALARHELACSVQEICEAAGRLLRFGGRLCLCQRPERLPDVICAMRAAGIEPKRLRMVQKRGDTAPWLFLIEGRKGSRPFCKIEPPLLIEAADGGYSQEMKRIYRIQEGKDVQALYRGDADRQPGGSVPPRGADIAGS